MTEPAARTRFLVLHDYGMGGAWWWVWADSADQVVQTYAEVVVVTDLAPPLTIEEVESWGLAEVDIDDPIGDPGLEPLREQRERQQQDPRFGALAGRDWVHLAEGARLLEVRGRDGLRTRQVEPDPAGGTRALTEADFPLNPPIDLWAPELADLVITAEQFEAAWSEAGGARPTDGDRS